LAEAEQPRAEEAPAKEAAERKQVAKVRATPLVRKVAAELDVDLERVQGSGPQGRITEDDVRSAAGGAASADTEGRREPVRGVRRLIAEHMGRAHREVPAVTWVEECDFTSVDIKQVVALTL